MNNAQHFSVLFQNSTQATRDGITELVLNRLSKAKAHQASGTKDGEESVSHLLTLARESGFKVGGHLNDFEELLQALGFSVREQVAGRSVRRYIGV